MLRYIVNSNGGTALNERRNLSLWMASLPGLERIYANLFLSKEILAHSIAPLFIF